MALVDKKLIAGDFTNHRIVDLPDKPSEAGINAQELKAAFDDISINIIGNRINQIIDVLLATTGGASGAHNIGSATISGVAGSTIAAQLADLKTQLDGVSSGFVVDGSINDAKLDQTGTNLWARFRDHAASLNAHFLSGLTTGTASAYALTDGVSSWATISLNSCLFLVRPHTNCAVNATVAICGGPALPIYPSTAGGLAINQMRQGGMYLLMWNPATSLLHILNPEPIIPDQSTGWLAAPGTWVHNLMLPGQKWALTISGFGQNVNNVIWPGDRIRFTQDGATVHTIVYGVGATSVTLLYSKEKAYSTTAISNVYFSHHPSPAGFPPAFGFTPSLRGTTTDGAFTYTKQAGLFQVVGGIMHVYMTLIVSAVTTPAAGQIQITGGPGDINATAPQVDVRLPVVASGIPFGASGTTINAKVGTAGTYLLYGSVSNGTDMAVDSSTISAGDIVNISGCFPFYFTT